MIRKIVGILFLIISIGAFAMPIETPLIKGAKVQVKGYPNPSIGVFSRETILGMCKLASNRQWYCTTFSPNRKQIYPREILGCKFYELPVQEELTYEVLSDGELFAIAPDNSKCCRTPHLKKIGFDKVESIKPFQMFGNLEENIVSVYKRAVKKGDTFTIPRPWVFIAGIIDDGDWENGEVLYNGIVLPRKWPPNYVPNNQGKWFPDGERVMPVPYLEKKPALINISVGRQLFVDDFLIESGDFEREYHLPKKFEGNPILKAETPLEKGKFGLGQPGAVPKDGGIWWNPEKEEFEMWYEAGWIGTYAFATSKDGTHWTRPNLNIYKEPNQIMPDKMNADSGAVILDYQSTDTNARYKMYNRGMGWKGRGKLWVSPDGKNWKGPLDCGPCGDRSTVFYNPFRKKWIFSLRWYFRGRSRTYLEVDDIVKGARHAPEAPVYWLSTDNKDTIRSEIKGSNKPQLYNFNAVAYESIMLGLYQIHWGPENSICAKLGQPKYTGLNFAYSRDGFHWSRPDRRVAIDSERDWGKWDNGYIQSVGGICTVHDDKIHIYYVGYQGDKKNLADDEGRSGMYSNGALGYAVLRRDGFVSINSKSAKKPAVLTTEPLQFAGSYLFANIDAPNGALYAEVVDINGNVVQPFSFDNCIPAKGDNTRARITWKGVKNNDLMKLANKPVKFRFKMDNGKFYSFWVSVSENGRSDGYVAGGGKGFYSNVDNVGSSTAE